MAKRKNNLSEPYNYCPPEDMFFGLELNDDQKIFRDEIMNGDKQVVVANATAGSGKTLLAIACAKLLCSFHGFDGAVYVFPTVEEGALGYRPGTTAEKEQDYTGPLYDALVKIKEVPNQAITSDVSLKNGTAWIEARSATFMRGINIENKVLIVDECQNLTVPIIKRILSRAHDSCRVIILGCTAQTDIPIDRSGFGQLIDYLGKFEDKVAVCSLPISYRGWLAQTIDKL